MAKFIYKLRNKFYIMTKTHTKKIITGVLLLTFLLIAVFVVRNREVVIEVEREAYSVGDPMRVVVKNGLLNSEICFSSCYPYFFQKKNDLWEEYSYHNCDFEDKIVKCVKPLRRKVFQTSVPNILNGTYRISVPVCENCSLGTVFSEEDRFYSNEFEIR